MSWSSVRKFPLTQDLTPLNRALRERDIPHKIVELAGQQVLQVPSREWAEPVSDFVDAWLAGDVVATPQSSAPRPQAVKPSSLWIEARLSPITLVLIALSLLGFAAAEWEVFNRAVVALTFTPLTPVPGGFAWGSLADTMGNGEYWRLITPAFLHFSIFHIAFNGLWTWELGRRLEWTMGKGRYLLFFVVTAIASNLAQYYWPGPVTLFGGMSGVIYAMVGYIGIYQWLKPEPLLAIPKGILLFMLAWLGICMLGVVDFFMAGGVANGAHLGGLVSGAIFALARLGLGASERKS